MNQRQFNSMVDQHKDEVMQQRGFSNMARALAQVTHIDPNDNHLVCFIGTGNERTNLEALTRWVKVTHLNTMPWDYDADDTLTDLTIKLECALEKHRSP